MSDWYELEAVGILKLEGDNLEGNILTLPNTFPTMLNSRLSTHPIGFVAAQSINKYYADYLQIL